MCLELAAHRLGLIQRLSSSINAGFCLEGEYFGLGTVLCMVLGQVLVSSGHGLNKHAAGWPVAGPDVWKIVVKTLYSKQSACG